MQEAKGHLYAPFNWIPTKGEGAGKGRAMQVLYGLVLETVATEVQDMDSYCTELR